MEKLALDEAIEQIATHRIAQHETSQEHEHGKNPRDALVDGLAYQCHSV